MEEILLNIESKEVRSAHLHNGLLQHLVIERKRERRLTGNIYKGKVTSTLDNIQSAFIDIGEQDNGFIHLNDIFENTKKFEEMYAMDFDLDEESCDKPSEENANIDQFLKKDQLVIVQVVKEPLGNKGARLTSNVSLAGRYLVLLPNTTHRGVSRKIEDRSARERLKRFIRSFDMPQKIGLICRTASRFATQEMLIDEAQELFNTWQDIVEKFNQAKKPTTLYEESDLIKRSLLDAIDKRYQRILVDDFNTYQLCKKMFDRYSSEHNLKVEYYRDKVPMYERFNVEREIDKTLKRKIWLPSGGYLYFDKTEAMYTIDVNSGRSNVSESNVEESLVQINLEASEEIARQLRLRNIGGLIICDFIDMRFRKNQRRVLNRLKECMKADAAKCTILGMSEFGLIEMTRQRHRSSLIQTMLAPCPYCQGGGLIKNNETVSIEIERSLKKVIRCQQQFALKLVVHPELDNYIQQIDKEYLVELAEELNARLDFGVDDTLHLNGYYFLSTTNGQLVEA